MTRLRALLLTLLPAALLASACAPAAPPASTGAAGPVRILQGPSHPLLSIAIARGQDLGPVAPTTPMHVTLGLVGRDPQGLAAALAAGQRFTPSQYAARFGPDPTGVAELESTLQAQGFTTHWSSGDTSLTATGPVSAVDSIFGVRIDLRLGPDGVRFFAPAKAASVPGSLASIVNAVTGLNNYPSASTAALPSPTGVSPANMVNFYNLTPLRNAGLDGSGMTVVFVEIDQFDPAMLAMYASKFHLPAFNVQTAPMNFGAPAKEAGEADLDLEIVHGIAPAAKEVVYYASSDNYLAAERQMYKDYPNGAIESSSVGTCEQSMLQNDATVIGNAQQAAAATGWSIFVASGDRGAYDCAPNGDFNDVVADMDASVPSVTAVGGTYVMFSSTGGYFHEVAWGEPIEQWGSSGGVSMFWKLPAWQVAPGVKNQYSNGMRQTPDISGNADGESGWDIFAQGKETEVGGTSAAAPFWAAIAALIDQDLKQKNLPLIGFANPALYYFAQNPSGLPAPPYHDITQGTNLYYPSTPGWDYPTGLGTADVGALTDDFEWYATHRPAGG